MDSPTSAEIPASTPKKRMSTSQRLLFFLTAWLICLMPFLFWWNTWFGRQLTDKELVEYLNDEKKPRHIQHALVQLGERMGKHDVDVTRWYPELGNCTLWCATEVMTRERIDAAAEVIAGKPMAARA